MRLEGALIEFLVLTGDGQGVKAHISTLPFRRNHGLLSQGSTAYIQVD